MDEIPLLEVRHLDKSYDNKYHANRDVSFKLQSGLLVGLIGPNGCGKTTLMRCINKIQPITSGDILIDGESILPKTSAEVAKLISNVPAEITASFGLTVFEIVMLGRYPYLQNIWWETEKDETIVTDALKNFNIYHLKDRTIDMLSSGERQRVMIAKAYVQNSKLMLVDEPTSHLDIRYKLNIMECLKALVEQNMTILVAEHDISMMARYCDLCIIMKSGELIAVGNPKEVITESLIRDVYGIDASVSTDKDGEIFVIPKKVVGNGGI
ncbi:MAG: ABC transporter ATP-binding protein [archaeon]|nr:ABC transporter ATP-binding protein [archaeon]